MTRFALAVASAFLLLSGAAKAAAVGFTTDPFAGSTALSTPGRQVVGGEPFITFSPATDQFIFDLSVFGVSQLVFANDIAANLPATGVNVIVLRSLDDDANPATAFGAGSAASLIAAQLTGPGPGFFIYFNSGLNLPRLVFSTDLSDGGPEDSGATDQFRWSAGCPRDILVGEFRRDARAPCVPPDGGAACRCGPAAPPPLATRLTGKGAHYGLRHYRRRRANLLQGLGSP